MPYISTGKEQLHYVQSGTGKRVLLAFHGFGETSSRFLVFNPELSAGYTILAFDLPHHGDSIWPNGVRLDADGLRQLIENVKQKFAVSVVSLMGYSIGGRVCLSIIATVPDSIEQVLLLATDGLSLNYNYLFLTRTFAGRSFFKIMLGAPRMAHSIARALHGLRVISPTRFRLVVGATDTNAKRVQLYNGWYSLSSLAVAPEKLRSVINTHAIPVVVIMGKYDKVLPPRLAHNFAKGARSVRVIVLPKGHKLFDETNVGDIAGYLL